MFFFESTMKAKLLGKCLFLRDSLKKKVKKVCFWEFWFLMAQSIVGFGLVCCLAKETKPIDDILQRWAHLLEWSKPTSGSLSGLKKRPPLL